MGKRMDCHRCPVALAMRRAFPRKLVSAGLYHLTVRTDEYATPAALRNFMNLFDAYQKVAPFSFRLPKKS